MWRCLNHVLGLNEAGAANHFSGLWPNDHHISKQPYREILRGSSSWNFRHWIPDSSGHRIEKEAGTRSMSTTIPTMKLHGTAEDQVRMSVTSSGQVAFFSLLALHWAFAVPLGKGFRAGWSTRWTSIMPAVLKIFSADCDPAERKPANASCKMPLVCPHAELWREGLSSWQSREDRWILMYMFKASVCHYVLFTAGIALKFPGVLSVKSISRMHFIMLRRINWPYEPWAFPGIRFTCYDDQESPDASRFFEALCIDSHVLVRDSVPNFRLLQLL